MEHSNLLAQVKETSEYFNQKLKGEKIDTVLILGSGMSGFEKRYEGQVVSYRDIPHFITPSVKGHSGQLTFTRIAGRMTAILSGRCHYYEEMDVWKIVHPLRSLIYNGAKKAVLTNAAGGVSSDYSPGDIITLKDHINLTGVNPLLGRNIDELGERFPDMSNVYDSELRELAKKSSEGIFDYKEGVYTWFTGPTYETPAEVSFAKAIGGDLVGMSTVPEVIAARHMGARIAAFSLVTNLAAGISKNPLSHQEVVEIAAQSAEKFQTFMGRFLEKVNKI